MDPNRKRWNERHKLLRQALNQPGGYPIAKDLFLCQHAMVHDAEMSKSGLYSFADEVWHTGNVVMDGAEVSQHSKTIDLDALKTYRLAVGRSTRDVVAVLPPDNINQKVDGVRLQQLLDDGSVPLDAVDLIEYWGNLTLAGLLLTPPTRHCLVHLNEALKVKRKCP